MRLLTIFVTLLVAMALLTGTAAAAETAEKEIDDPHPGPVDTYPSPDEWAPGIPSGDILPAPEDKFRSTGGQAPFHPAPDEWAPGIPSADDVPAPEDRYPQPDEWAGPGIDTGK